MNKHTLTTFSAVAAACFAGSSVFAGNPAPTPAQAMQESLITGDIGFDVVSNFIFRGIPQQNQGFIIQPYTNLHFRIYDSSGPITSITADIGIWNSFHDQNPLASPGSSVSNWYRFDFLAGLTFNSNKLAISPYFRSYASPSDVFDTAYTMGLRIAYDDRELLGDFSLNPYALVELQLQGTTGNNYPLLPGSSFHGRGQYYEVGIAPAHSYGDLTLSVPLRAGFGTGGFYLGNRGFGFFSAGLNASYALSCIPSGLGKWAIHGGATYYQLGGNSSGIFSRSGAAGLAPASLPGNGLADNSQFVFSGGLKVEF